MPGLQTPSAASRPWRLGLWCVSKRSMESRAHVSESHSFPFRDRIQDHSFCHPGRPHLHVFQLRFKVRPSHLIPRGAETPPGTFEAGIEFTGTFEAGIEFTGTFEAGIEFTGHLICPIHLFFICFK